MNSQNLSGSGAELSVLTQQDFTLENWTGVQLSVQMERGGLSPVFEPQGAGLISDRKNGELQSGPIGVQVLVNDVEPIGTLNGVFSLLAPKDRHFLKQDIEARKKLWLHGLPKATRKADRHKMLIVPHWVAIAAFAGVHNEVPWPIENLLVPIVPVLPATENYPTFQGFFPVSYLNLLFSEGDKA